MFVLSLVRRILSGEDITPEAFRIEDERRHLLCLVINGDCSKLSPDIAKVVRSVRLSHSIPQVSELSAAEVLQNHNDQVIRNRNITPTMSRGKSAPENPNPYMLSLPGLRDSYINVLDVFTTRGQNRLNSLRHEPARARQELEHAISQLREKLIKHQGSIESLDR